jgi:hypothetical protein
MNCAQMATNIAKMREVRAFSEWERLFAQARSPFMTQSWAFGEAKRAMGWTPKRFRIGSQDEVWAICQVLFKSIAGIPLLARINLGPLFINDHDDKAADTLLAIRQHWSLLRRGVLFIAPTLESNEINDRVLLGIGFRRRSQFRWTSSRLDLTQPEDLLRGRLNANWRNQLGKAERSNLRFNVGNAAPDIQWIIQRSIENSIEKGFDGPSPTLIAALSEASPADVFVFRAKYDGEDVAGMMAYRFADHAHYYLGWNGSAGRKLNAGNFILWNAILYLRGQRCKVFDLGGHGLSGNSGFTAFKLGLKGAPYQTSGEYVCV